MVRNIAPKENAKVITSQYGGYRFPRHLKIRLWRGIWLVQVYNSKSQGHEFEPILRVEFM